MYMYMYRTIYKFVVTCSYMCTYYMPSGEAGWLGYLANTKPNRFWGLQISLSPAAGNRLLNFSGMHPMLSR